MRHRVVGRKLSRTASHRRALLRSLSTELLRHKRIVTTEAKAKEASRFVEGLISKARRAWNSQQNGGTVNHHARRMIGRNIKDKKVLRELFSDIAEKVADRPGGYTRVVRIGRRNGDGAEMAVLELVDYNLDRDESAVRSRSKNLMSRAERVRRSQEKQKQMAEVAEVEEVEEATEKLEGTPEVEATEDSEGAPASEAEESVAEEADAVEESASEQTDEASDESESTDGSEEEQAQGDEEEKQGGK
ncbi:MAG: 50S ribosomal protein L17 [Chlorobi bacterium]|nr:50S ribosomal protein L17 [Chlorobiota bacterium]